MTSLIYYSLMVVVRVIEVIKFKVNCFSSDQE